MKKSVISLLIPLCLPALATAQTILVEENFAYADGDVSVVGIGGTGWDATQGGWQVGNSNATRRFIVSSETALYQGGGNGTRTEQNRTFAAALTSSVSTTIDVSFTLLRPERQSGRGIGIYLTDGGANQFFIGKKINGGVGLHAAINGTTYETFGSNGNPSEPIVATITYDGTDTSIVLSDSNETLAAHTVAGTLTIDGISLAGYHPSTTTNGIDDILVTTTSNPDPWLIVDDVSTFTTNNAVTTLDIPISNDGATQELQITAVTPGGADAGNITLLSSLPIIVPIGSDGVVSVEFTPDATPFRGSYTASLELTSTDTTNSPKTITIDITNNPDPWIEASDATLVNDGAADNYSVTVGNLGDATGLTISDVVVGDTDAGTISGLTFPGPIAPGLDDTIDFTFTPNDGARLYFVSLTIASDDPATPSKVVDLTIDVQDPLIAVDPVLEFGVLPYTPGVQVLSLPVFNDGGAEDLVIANTTAITGAPEFAITNTTFPITITPGTSADIEITFTPGSGSGRFNATLTIDSNDFNSTTPQVLLTGLVEPTGTVVARFDFDPNSISGSTVDVDGSLLTAWTTGDLIDEATGTGALGGSNQSGANRDLPTGVSGDYLRFSSNREGDAQTPLLPGGNNESTWTTFTVTPDTGGGSIDFTGGAAVVDTYANTSLGSNTAADWTLYYLPDGAPSWTSLGTAAGASTSNGLAGPLGLTWDLTSIGSQSAPVAFLLDPVSTGGTNGSASQRGIGFDNLILTAGSVTPGTGFESWAAGFGIPNDPNDDSDKDGIPAVVEYGLGLDPTVPDGAPGTLTGGLLSYTKGAEAVANGDVTYAIETSTDLGDTDPWTPVDPGDLEEGTATDPSTISYTLPTGVGKIFARLRVTQVL